MNDENREEKGRKQAVALRYDRPRDPAPRVVAKGQGAVAKRILEIAREHNIPIYEDADLLEVLGKIDLDEVIPVELYQAVAEVLAFLYRLNSQQAGKTGRTGQQES